MSKVVILLNIGGIYSPKKARSFLKNMFYDDNILTIKHPILRKILANIIINSRINSTKKIYATLPNGSRIFDLSQNLVDKLNLVQSEFKFDFAFNYSEPYFKEVLEKYKNAKEITLFPLFPQFSTTTVLSALQRSNSILNDFGFSGNVKVVKPFYKDKEFNTVIINKIKQNFDEQATLIFSAHSLPQKIIKNGDSYFDETLEHFDILKDELISQGYRFKDFVLSFQSKLGPIKWLEPNTIDIIKNLEVKRALIYPISFCIDNSETDYELKIAYKELAQSLNYSFFRVIDAPNDTQEFVNYILQKVKNL